MACEERLVNFEDVRGSGDKQRAVVKPECEMSLHFEMAGRPN